MARSICASLPGVLPMMSGPGAPSERIRAERCVELFIHPFFFLTSGGGAGVIIIRRSQVYAGPRP